jgi:hypothetical protein
VSNEKKDRDEFDEEELIRSEFESIVSGLSLDRIDREGFIQPNPPRQSPQGFITSARNAIDRWLKRGHHDDDGVAL